MNFLAFAIAYVVAGLGFYAINSTKPPRQHASLWHNPFACAFLWPVTLFATPWYGAFFGTLLNAAIIYSVLAFIFSLF